MIIRSGIIVGLFTLLSRIFGFIRDIFITKYLGTGSYADIFNIAFRLPNFFRRIFAEGALSSSFVPIYISKNNSEAEAKKFASHVFTMLFLVLLIVITILELALPKLMYILAPGFSSIKDLGKFQLAIELSSITLPYLLFISLTSLIGDILNSKGKFFVYAFAPSILNIVIILSLQLTDYAPTPVHALSYGVIVAGIFQLLFLVIISFRYNLLPKFSKPSIDEDMKKLFKNMLPAIFGGSIMQVNILIDQAIASFIPGAISILSYAERIIQLPLALIGTAIGTVLLPNISKQIHLKNFEAADYTQNRAVEIALLLSLPASFALGLIAEPLICMLFQRGAFTSIDTIKTARALQAFAIGLPAYILVKVLVTRFYAMYNTKTPVKIAFLCLISNATISIILIKPLGYVGIAISTSISAWLNASSLLFILSSRSLVTFDTRLKEKLPKIILCTGVMSGLIIICLEYTSHILNLKNYSIPSSYLLVIIILALATFILAAYFTKVIDFSELKHLFRKNNKTST